MHPNCTKFVISLLSYTTNGVLGFRLRPRLCLLHVTWLDKQKKKKKVFKCYFQNDKEGIYVFFFLERRERLLVPLPHVPPFCKRQKIAFFVLLTWVSTLNLNLSQYMSNALKPISLFCLVPILLDKHEFRPCLLTSCSTFLCCYESNPIHVKHKLYFFSFIFRMWNGEQWH